MTSVAEAGAAPGRGRYVYAVTRGLDPAMLAGTTGLDEAPLEVVAHRDLTAVVSSVDLDEYGEEGLRANLEDLAWLERVARGHDAVVQAAAAEAPTAPMRLAMICRDDAGVVERLAAWHDDLTDVLDRVEGRVEWSVKVYAARRPEAPAAGETTTQAPTSGAAYLQRKKAEAQARRTEETTAQLVAEEVHEQLMRGAVAGRRLAVQDPRLTGRADRMLHNGAYLVEAARSTEFAALVDEVETANPDVVVEFHGPWPPYSFATLEQS
jgi:hypothetical protein